MLIEVLLKVRPEPFGLSCTIMTIRMIIAYFSVTYWVIIDEDVVGFVINGFLKLTNCWKLSVLFPEKELKNWKPFLFRQIIWVFFLFLSIGP